MTSRWPAVVAIPALIVVALLVDQGSDGAARDEASAQAEAAVALSRMMPTASRRRRARVDLVLRRGHRRGGRGGQPDRRRVQPDGPPDHRIHHCVPQ